MNVSRDLKAQWPINVAMGLSRVPSIQGEHSPAVEAELKALGPH
jgi:hypothetical protein